MLENIFNSINHDSLSKILQTLNRRMTLVTKIQQKNPIHPYKKDIQNVLHISFIFKTKL